MKLIFFFLINSLFFLPLKGNYIESFSEPWGIDSEFVYIKREDTQNQNSKIYYGRSICKGLIRFFQNYISPIDGPRSSFYPSSSQYTFEAIQKYGVFRGISMGCDRLMRENNETWIYKNIKKEGIQLKIDLLQ